ncbi:MAG: hypothetical protein ACKV19_01435 [Verrucomicrobiales bacterium]
MTKPRGNRHPAQSSKATAPNAITPNTTHRSRPRRKIGHWTHTPIIHEPNATAATERPCHGTSQALAKKSIAATAATGTPIAHRTAQGGRSIESAESTMRTV